jgi:hypothetical protein
MKSSIISYMMTIDIIYDIIGQFVQSAPQQLSAAPAAAASLRHFLVPAAINLLSLRL